MAWTFGDSYDCYATIADMALGYWDSGAFSNAGITPGRFAGSQGLFFNTAGVAIVKSSGVNDAVHHISIAYRQTAVLTGTTLAGYFQLSDGAVNQCCIVFRSDGAVLLTSATPAGTVLATYAGAVTAQSTWFQFEFEVVIHNVSGSFKARKNGSATDDHSTTGINTRPGANAYANKLTHGQNATLNAPNFDDLLWRSDAASVPWVGDIRCITRMPASDVSVQFSRVPTGALTQTVGSAATTTTAVSLAYYSAFTAGWSGTVTSAGVAFGAVGNAVNMKCAIFADNGSGAPGALLASALAPVTPVVLGTNTFTFAGVSIVKGVQYWVGACTDGTTGHAFSSTTTSVAAGTSGSSSYAAFPQTSPVTSGAARIVNMSWTYTASANWQMVAETLQDGTTSYVYDSTPGHSDLYTIASIASTPTSTVAVTARAFMQKSDAGARTAAVQMKSGATTVTSNTATLSSSSWGWTWRTELLDPATGTAWSAAAVNNVTIGPVCVA